MSTEKTPGAAFARGDPRAREAGRKGAEAARRNRESGKPPSAGAGPKDKAPKRGSGFGQTTRTVATKTRQRITALIGTGIVLADGALAKAVETWREDQLGADEVKMLTDAIVGTALKYPKVARRMEQAAVASDLAAIPTALLLIALPRLVKRGMVPRTLATTVSPLLDESQKVSEASTLLEERMAAADEERLERERAADLEPPPAPTATNGATEAPAPEAPIPTPIRPPEPAVAAPGQIFKPPPGF